MKIITVVVAVIGLVLLFFLFYKPQLKIDFQVTNVASDTTFENPIWHVNDRYGRHIALRAIGELDAPTEVFVNDPKFPNKFLPATLPKGRFDTTWVGEYYERKAEIVFLHKEAKLGNLKLVFRYLTPDGDTIAQVSTSAIDHRLPLGSLLY